MILDIDNIPATEDELTLIKNSKCINCYKPYSKDKKILFYKTSRNIFWWHIKPRNNGSSCAPTKLYTFRGKSLNLGDWGKELNISRETLLNRFKRRWSVDKAFTTKVRKSKINKGV